jgi:hypothetical protein
VANVMALLGVEASEDHKAVLRGLGNGECIFRDLEGRAGRIGIDLISDDVRQWLDTNPTRARAAGETPGPASAPAQDAGPPSPPVRDAGPPSPPVRDAGPSSAVSPPGEAAR